MATYSETPAAIQNGVRTTNGVAYTVTSGFYALVSIYFEGSGSIDMSGTAVNVNGGYHEILMDEGDTLNLTLSPGPATLRHRAREYGRP